MPVPVDQVDQVAATMADIYAQAETALVALISRHLAAGLQASDWALRKLNEVRALRRAAQLVVDHLETTGTRTLHAGVAATYRTGSANVVTELAGRYVGDVGPLARSARVLAGPALEALADAAVGELRPLHEAILPQVDRAYRQAVAGAVARRLAGVQDMRTAAQAAWSTLTDQGITRFVDGRGRHWALHTWVEMATRTALSRATLQGQIDTYAAARQELVYVTDRPRECPRCRPWEHQVLSLGEPALAPAVATLAQAREAGLFHPNCRHGISAWWPGIRLSRGTADPAGYEASQRQRYLERGLRGWRTRQAAAITPDAQAQAHAWVSQWQDALHQHLAAHPYLRRATHREHPGAGFEAPPHRRGDRAHLPSRGRG